MKHIVPYFHDMKKFTRFFFARQKCCPCANALIVWKRVKYSALNISQAWWYIDSVFSYENCLCLLYRCLNTQYNIFPNQSKRANQGWVIAFFVSLTSAFKTLFYLIIIGKCFKGVSKFHIWMSKTEVEANIGKRFKLLTFSRWGVFIHCSKYLISWKLVGT